VSFAPTTVTQALDSAVTAFGAAGLDTPQLDAEVLLAHALGTDRTRLAIEPEAAVEGDAITSFRDAVRRRSVDREPVAYITGTKGFRHIELHVDRRVLIPRPDTETLVEAAVESLPMQARVVDVGTGSGAIALALKDERPDLAIIGTDLSADALDVARANAQRLGLEVEFVEGDLLAGVRADAVVCNPPYVRDDAQLAPEIARHEPALALFAGPEGMDAYRRLAPGVSAAGASWVALEVGEGQADAVTELVTAAGYPHAERRRDLAGVERVVVAWR